jgi:hypothetical protein
MQLLDLPLEIFQQIIEQLFYTNGARSTLEARQVSSM